MSMEIKQPGGHLDQMLRQTRNHHVQLSTMADTKANMLLTISSVTMTLSIGHLNEPGIKWPAVILICSCLVTIILAAYAVMPKLPVIHLNDEKPNVKDPHFNLLFFGDFTGLEYKDFAKAMEEMMNDPSQMYEMQVREVYTLGKFLAAKKYRFVRMAYLSYISGLLLAVTLLLMGAFFF